MFMLRNFQGYAEVEELLKKESICIAWTDKLIKDSGVATASAYDKIVTNLIKKKAARGQCFNVNLPLGSLLSTLCI